MCEQTGASLQSSTDVCRTSWCFIILQHAVRSRPWKVKLERKPCPFDNVDYFKNCVENLKNGEFESVAVFNCHLEGIADQFWFLGVFGFMFWFRLEGVALVGFCFFYFKHQKEKKGTVWTTPWIRKRLS